MKEEDKELLLKDLCARLPYGVIVKAIYDKPITREMGLGTLHDFMFDNISDVKPYLRPIESMTEKEKKEFSEISNIIVHTPDEFIDWLNEHHFDYRGLIEKGLAIELK